MLKEFKKFAFRGNVMDMAVGVIIGSALTKIVNSLVSDLFMPVIGILTGGINVSGLTLTLVPAKLDAAGAVLKEAVTLNYGMFIQNVINFLLVAFALFLMVKGINKLRDAVPKKKDEAEAEPAPEPQKADDVLLLEEIRDLLKKDAANK